MESFITTIKIILTNFVSYSSENFVKVLMPKIKNIYIYIGISSAIAFPNYRNLIIELDLILKKRFTVYTQMST